MSVVHPPLFSVSTDFDARLIRYRFERFWDLATFEAFKAVVVTDMRKFHQAGVMFDMLGDLRKYLPQHQYLNEPRQAMIDTARKLGLRKCAIIAETALVKLQLGRLSNNSYVFFSSEDEALAWIRA